MTLWRIAFEEHGPAVLAFLHSRLGNRHDAEDLLQDTFVRAIKSSGSLRDAGKVRSYLFSIAHNQMVNFVRRRKEVSLEVEGVETPPALESYSLEQSQSPEHDSEYHELQDKLGDVMKRMSPSHRSAFQLGVLEQKSYNEIARLTRWSPAQVKINVYRARKKAISELREWWMDDRE